MTNPQPPLTTEELTRVADALLGRAMPSNFRVMIEALFRQIEWQSERLTEAQHELELLHLQIWKMGATK